MSARSMGSATISFGLVNIPVKLYAATSDARRISFNLLHANCGSRLKQQYVCLKDGEAVPADAQVKGYEFAKGQYVQFTKEEVKELEEKPSQSVDIHAFVPVGQVDALYFDKSYYLGPDKGGERAYALLVKAMRKTGRAALAQYAARGKQYLVLVRGLDDHLVMQQLHYAYDLKPIAEVPVGKAEVKPSEMELAVQLIESIAKDTFAPERFHDTVHERIEAAIARKVEGKEVTAEPSETPRAQIVDLMAALKASLKDDKRKPARSVGKKKATKSKASRKG